LHKAKERMRECLTLKHRPTQHLRNSRRRLGAMKGKRLSMATAASLHSPKFCRETCCDRLGFAGDSKDDSGVFEPNGG
jgi:hypothetical protein